MGPLLRFFADNLPTLRELLTFGPMYGAFAMAALAGAGWLKRAGGLRTGYSRKVFHFSIFAVAAFLHWRYGTRPVCLFGAMTTLAIAYAIWRGEGNLFYEAIAREKDAPHRTLYVVVPYLATLTGGLASTICFGPAALVGFLVTGVGDAIAEPIGTRFGRHTYRVPSMRGVACTRSIEGSAAVLIASTLAAFAGLHLAYPETVHDPIVMLKFATAIGAASTVCEAISPHGWDNLTLQILPAGMAYAYLN